MSFLSPCQYGGVAYGEITPVSLETHYKITVILVNGQKVFTDTMPCVY